MKVRIKLKRNGTYLPQRKIMCFWKCWTYPYSGEPHPYVFAEFEEASVFLDNKISKRHALMEKLNERKMSKYYRQETI